jgi:hypothetical protein
VAFIGYISTLIFTEYMKTFKVEKIIPESSNSDFKYHFQIIRVNAEQYDIFLLLEGHANVNDWLPFIFHFFFFTIFSINLKKTDH